MALSWELDLLGRQTRQRQAASARADGAGATIEAVRLAVAAEVARTWFQLQGARERVELRSGSVTAQLRIAALTGDMVELGRAPPGDLARSMAESATDQAELAQARDTVFALEARLAVLLGETPGAWRAPPSREMLPLTLKTLALPDPHTLLRSRPDVRAAERALAASAADAHAAGAARFPRLTLSGLLGFVAGDLGGLFSSTTDSRAQGAQVSWSLFSLPRLQADYRQSQAGSHLALAEYDQVVLAAMEETEVALQRYGSSTGQVRLRLEAAHQARAAADAAQARYEEGAAPALEALVSRRDAVGNEVAAIESLVRQRVAVVDVLRALGTAPVVASPVAEL
jgi:outer membrane protein TolC